MLLLIIISVLNGLIWYGIGRYRSQLHVPCVSEVHSYSQQSDEVCGRSCSARVSDDLPILRPLLTKGFMRYKESSLVKVPYPEWSILMQPNKSSRCDIVVNPHVSRKRQYLCLAVVTVSSDSTYNLLRIETDTKTPTTSIPIAAISPETDSAILNITGFFNNVAVENGRKKLADKMLKLLPNLLSLKQYILYRLLERELTIGSDIVVMVVNAGEIDLLANFACSCKHHNISMRNMMVFAGSEDVLPLIESFGAIGIYHQLSFADVSRNASYEYLDRIFIDMMWYKSFSVWLLLKLQYNVLFQDVDIIWYRDPVQYFRTASTLPVLDTINDENYIENLSTKQKITHLTDNIITFTQKNLKNIPYFNIKNTYKRKNSENLTENIIKNVEKESWGHSLNSLPQADAYLSDDGQRSLRYTPFFANSGFYYLVSNVRTVYFTWTILSAFDLLHITGSHQNIFTIKLIEALDIANIKPKLLSLREFPSGVKYNHDKPYMRAIQDGHEHPFIFHM